MTLSEVDSELAQWHDRKSLIDENLNSFVELPIFQRLSTDTGGTPGPFVGQTQARVAAAMEVFRGLRQQQAVLAATLDRAAELRASLSRLMPARHTLQEIEQILSGQSIELESSPTPPQRRELLRDVAQTVRVSPGQFLKIMLDSFRFVRDTAVGVASAGQQNAEGLNAQRIELSRLRGAAGQRPSKALDQATQLLSDLNSLSEHDPLAAAEQIPSLVALIQKTAQDLDAVSHQRIEANNLLREAAPLLERIHQTHDRATSTFAERELKAESAREASVPRPSLDEEVAALGSWLSKLQTTVQKGEFGPAGIGLKTWTESAAAILARDQQAIEADETALRARRELRGLFDALQAKACNCGRAEEARLVSLGSEIKRLLARRPTPMAEARELVSRYQEHLV